MPNWCEGSLKLRGKYEDILRFFDERINAYERNISNGQDGSAAWCTMIPKEEWCDFEEFDGETVISNRLKASGWIYIEDTNRAFVLEDFCSYGIFRTEDDNKCIFVLPFKQAWSIRQSDWTDIAQKYNLEVKIFVIESGTGFWCTFHCLSDGVILEANFHQTDNYKDFVWDCPLPWMGG